MEKIKLEEGRVEREQKNRKFNILIRNTYRPNMFKECIESVQEQTHIIPILGNNVRIICCYDDKRSSKYLKKYKNMFKNINLLEIVPNKDIDVEKFFTDTMNNIWERFGKDALEVKVSGMEGMKPKDEGGMHQ